MSEISVTDKKLMDDIRQNDYISYNILFTRYYSRLCQYVYSILSNKEDAEDIVQELFMNVWNNRKKTAIHENVSAYFYKTAKNMTLNHIRDNKKHQDLFGMYDTWVTDEDQTETDEYRIALYDCIEQLPPRSKEVLLLHRMEGLKQKEISERLSISVKTIKAHIWNALQKLKNCLENKRYDFIEKE